MLGLQQNWADSSGIPYSPPKFTHNFLHYHHPPPEWYMFQLMNLHQHIIITKVQSLHQGTLLMLI